VVQPSVDVFRFKELTRALQRATIQVAYKGSVAINLEEPAGYPPPDMLWRDGATQSFGTEYIVNNVESTRLVSVTLGQRSGTGVFTAASDPDLQNRWSFNASLEPASRNLAGVPSINPNYEPTAAFQDSILKQRNFHDLDANNLSIWSPNRLNVRDIEGRNHTQVPSSFTDLSEWNGLTRTIAGAGTIQFSSAAV